MRWNLLEMSDRPVGYMRLTGCQVRPFGQELTVQQVKCGMVICPSVFWVRALVRGALTPNLVCCGLRACPEDSGRRVHRNNSEPLSEVSRLELHCALWEL